MVGTKPLSLSASRLKSDVKKAVDAAVSKHKLQNLKIAEGMAISHHGIVGFVISDGELGKTSIADISVLANSVATALKGGEPASMIKGGHIIVGFMPPAGITAIKE